MFGGGELSFVLLQMMRFKESEDYESPLKTDFLLRSNKFFFAVYYQWSDFKKIIVFVDKIKNHNCIKIYILFPNNFKISESNIFYFNALYNFKYPINLMIEKQLCHELDGFNDYNNMCAHIKLRILDELRILLNGEISDHYKMDFRDANQFIEW